MTFFLEIISTALCLITYITFREIRVAHMLFDDAVLKTYIYVLVIPVGNYCRLPDVLHGSDFCKSCLNILQSMIMGIPPKIR